MFSVDTEIEKRMDIVTKLWVVKTIRAQVKYQVACWQLNKRQMGKVMKLSVDKIIERRVNKAHLWFE